ncbi:ankyrin repeat domain-containing protein [Wolbachia endosymbiont of Trichogramma kaykai]|uniref:ankyrin repeat domain-containing protein n=1 Tax=Wolbachia endosymbiont of Trichogramma kaykai TaxID=444066 RepID=UPI003892B29D
MKNTLYFILLVAIFLSSNLFAVEQSEENINQEDVSKSNTDAEKTSPLLGELKESTDSTNVVEIPSSDPKESTTQNVINQEVHSSNENIQTNLQPEEGNNIKDTKALTSPLSEEKKEPEENKISHNNQTNLQPEEGNNIKDTELSTSQSTEKKKEEQPDNITPVDKEEEGNNIKDTKALTSPLSEEKKEPEENKISHNNQTNLQPEEGNNIKDTELSTSQSTEKKKEEQPDNITPVDKENEESEKWTKLNKEIKKEWNHKSKSIYKRQYDILNEHLPKTIFTDDYSKQFFYCIKKGNLICLRGVINKLEKIGLTIQEILRFRNKLGDTPLIYAVKQGKIDTVRFLLLQGADPRVVDNNFKSLIEIAIERKQINIINAIAEMMPYLLEDKEINNEEDSEMYNFAIKTKESTCDAKDN